MTPNDIMNYIRCSDTHEMREMLEEFKKGHPAAFALLAQQVIAHKWKRKPEAFLAHALQTNPSR
jgi:hypothetical protein